MCYFVFNECIGKKYELPIKDGAINATDLSKIKDEKGEVTRSYDPAYMNTVCCVSYLYFLTLINRYLKSLTLTEMWESLNTEVIPSSS